MNLTYQIKKNSIEHPLMITILRVILGVCLVIKGIYFINHTIVLNTEIANSSLNSLNITDPLVLFITWANLLGGTFIILGLITRISVWVQIPILLGAIIFIHSDLLLAIAVFILLIFFAFEGAGRISMDSYVKNHLL